MREQRYNVFERNNSGADGLIKINVTPLKRQVAELLRQKRQERAKGNQKYLILLHREPRGYEVHRMSIY